MAQPAITLVIPNFNRVSELQQTLERITELNELDKQILVIDNASTDGAPEMVERRFPQVELVRLDQNLGTAARNVGLERARASITLMLDNDSYPEPGILKNIHQAFEQERHLGILACRVKLPSGRHESGGLPGVFVGCGAAMRTDLIRQLGGYPEDYGYYVEEYDLSCRVWQSGYRVRWSEQALVHHAKSPSQRNMDRILYFLTRNNLQLWHRFSPPARRAAMLRQTAARYAAIARIERAVGGFLRGLTGGWYRIARQYRRRTELTPEQFDALFGGRAIRAHVEAMQRDGLRTAAIFGWGKGLEQIIEYLREGGIAVTRIIGDRPLPIRRWMSLPVDRSDGNTLSEDALVVGSLSPGVAMDYHEQAQTKFPNARVVRLADFS